VECSILSHDYGAIHEENPLTLKRLAFWPLAQNGETERKLDLMVIEASQSIGLPIFADPLHSTELEIN